MLNPCLRIAALGVVFYAVTAAATADAAKGVKKSALANGQQIVTGTILSIAPDGEGGGMIQLRAANQHRKMMLANANGAAANSSATGNLDDVATASPATNAVPYSRQFAVTPATQFYHQNGTVLNGSAIVVGTHVRVLAMGNQAQSVQVLARNRSMGNFIRYRANSYVPHHHVPHHVK